MAQAANTLVYMIDELDAGASERARDLYRGTLDDGWTSTADGRRFS